MEVVDVRGLNPAERQEKVRSTAIKLKSGEVIEIISDDPRMPQLAPKIVKALGGLEIIKVEEGKEGLFHTYLRKV